VILAPNERRIILGVPQLSHVSRALKKKLTQPPAPPGPGSLLGNIGRLLAGEAPTWLAVVSSRLKSCMMRA
jgi:hypothetical protein